jgi:hypothetical protein
VAVCLGRAGACYSHKSSRLCCVPRASTWALSKHPASVCSPVTRVLLLEQHDDGLRRTRGGFAAREIAHGRPASVAAYAGRERWRPRERGGAHVELPRVIGAITRPTKELSISSTMDAGDRASAGRVIDHTRLTCAELETLRHCATNAGHDGPPDAHSDRRRLDLPSAEAIEELHPVSCHRPTQFAHLEGSDQRRQIVVGAHVPGGACRTG